MGYCYLKVMFCAQLGTVIQYVQHQLCLVIKRPARDACLCMGELPAPPAPAAPPAPHFVFLITL